VRSLPRAVWICVALLSMGPSCIADTSERPRQVAVSPTPEGIQNERFIVRGGHWRPRNLDRRVPIRATIVNHSDEVRSPTCYLVDRSVGLIGLDDPSPMEPGEERAVTGTASFPIPTFNYECDGLCKGVKCDVRGEEPPYIRRYLLAYERIPAPGTRVTVPNLDGKYLHEVGYPLYRRGLRIRFSTLLPQAWRHDHGRKPFDANKELRLVLMNLILLRGPKVRLEPQPGSNVRAGTTIVLQPD